MPLKGSAKHANKVELKVRLPSRPKGVEASVGSLCLAVAFILVKSLINTREANEFQQPRANGASLVTLIRGHGLVIKRSLSENIIIETITILNPEDKRNDGVVEKVLANVRGVDLGGDAVARQLG
uniref:Uncharacterized protein n=1 Tax=Photinus pyralis TaxID=7054 RepID=A0A1Y1MQI0_PHOPY